MNSSMALLSVLASVFTRFRSAISDISVIYYMPNLRYLEIRGNPIADKEPLYYLPADCTIDIDK